MDRVARGLWISWMVFAVGLIVAGVWIGVMGFTGLAPSGAGFTSPREAHATSRLWAITGGVVTVGAASAFTVGALRKDWRRAG